MSDAKKLYLSGNTFPVKDALRALGARWDADKKAWYCTTEDMQAKATEVLKGAPAKAAGHGAGQPTKRCWECGCTFTYAQAKQYGGDWNDSYCGC
jgi:hypothetical protein